MSFGRRVAGGYWPIIAAPIRLHLARNESGAVSGRFGRCPPAGANHRSAVPAGGIQGLELYGVFQASEADQARLIGWTRLATRRTLRQHRAMRNSTATDGDPFRIRERAQ